MKDPANSSTITGCGSITMEDGDVDGLSALPGSTVKSKRQMEKSKTRMIKGLVFTAACVCVLKFSRIILYSTGTYSIN